MLHGRCLIIYNDKQSSFTELLIKDSSVSIHIRNIQRLAIEMFRFCNGSSPPLMNNIFKLKAENPYSLIQVSDIIFVSPQVKRIGVISNKHGIYELPNDLRLRALGN